MDFVNTHSVKRYYSYLNENDIYLKPHIDRLKDTDFKNSNKKSDPSCSNENWLKLNSIL